jgi:hypothetical protein
MLGNIEWNIETWNSRIRAAPDTSLGFADSANRQPDFFFLAIRRKMILLAD